MDLKGKVAIVTGAARGLGQGIVLTLAREGMSIALVDLDKAALDARVAELQDMKVKALAVVGDVTSAISMGNMAQSVIDHFGQIDVLVNNAGVIVVKSLLDTDEADWDKVFDVNLKGIFLASKAVLPHMMARRAGRIVNISSMAGLRGNGLVPAYTASKWGVIGLTQSMAHGFGSSNINVNAVCPGVIETAMWSGAGSIGEALSPTLGIKPEEVAATFMQGQSPLGRTQTAEDIGEAVAYLCKADNVTGIHLVVDGGVTAG